MFSIFSNPIQTTHPVDIPECLTDYEPCGSFSTLTWKVSEKWNTISVVRRISCFRHIKNVLFLVSTAFLFAGFLLFVNHVGFEGKEKGFEILAQLCVYIFVPVFLVIGIFVSFMEIKGDYYSWKSPRFAYDRDTGEMRFFQFIYDWDAVRPESEFFEINKKDCRRIILGWTSGYNEVGMAEHFTPSGEFKGFGEGHININVTKGFQFYMIIQENTGQWKKFILASEPRKRAIQKAIRALEPWLDCETLERPMTIAQCRRIHIQWVEDGHSSPFALRNLR